MEKQKRASRQKPEVREFILRNATEHPTTVARKAADHFDLTRTTINRYMTRLQDEGLLAASGNTRARRYTLKPLTGDVHRIRIFRDLPEDQIWRFRIQEHLNGLPENVVALCRYGFTEMLNNAIDHSASNECMIGVKRTYADVSMYVRDYGIGIFKKIQQDFNLPDAQSALLELSKGRLTSDSKRHSGEGIYFTSRMFDRFNITSEDTFYERNRLDGDEWFIEIGDRRNAMSGTRVFMRIATNAGWSPSDVFAAYAGDTIGFRRTNVPVKLGLYPGDELVSRSQAKRVLARFENFSEVLLDFDGVRTIGQPFADEIFRVFANEHPAINVFAVRTSPRVQRVIDHVLASGEIQNELSLKTPTN